jgi:2-octaprenyl-6-methoxyphenol hydroxylase
MNADVIIVGGNYSGLSLAAALGAAGLDVVVLERGPKKLARFDGRTLAVSFRSMQMLQKAGVGDLIEKDACPMLDIRIADQGSTAHLDFDHKEVGNNPFGWIIENHLFHRALNARLSKIKSVRIISSAAVKSYEFNDPLAQVTLEDKRIFKAPLIIGADGRNSSCRAAAGIPVYGWKYRQTAIACVIHHSEPHHNIAVEHFQPGGPFATLPMTKKRSSIIWTEKTATADALMKMSERAFTQTLQAKVEDWLGKIKLAGARFAYPLALQHAKSYIAPRLALIGDAAHSIHPIAGQGFNLGMGDIEVLTDELSRGVRLGLDPGNPEILRRYEKRRKFDNGNMVLMTDGLVRLFSNSIPPVEAARRVGLGAVQALPPLKRFFMRTAMGT